MLQLLLLCMILFQADTQTATKPVIDNDRVSVLDVSDYSTPAQPTDAVVVSLWQRGICAERSYLEDHGPLICDRLEGSFR